MPIAAKLGKGKRTGKYGVFLLACYDPDNDEFQCISKIGTGFSDEDLATHFAFLSQHTVAGKPSNVLVGESLVGDMDVWFDPCQVWEVKGADLTISPVYQAGVGVVHETKGISLRFPRFERIRDDKNPDDATNSEQIVELYNAQFGAGGN